MKKELIGYTKYGTLESMTRDQEAMKNFYLGSPIQEHYSFLSH